MSGATGLFHFKQFSVCQDRSAMKLGTDAIVLGAWVARLAWSPTRILDIGTGTGVLALMMAQAYPVAEVEAIELDAEAATEARDNFARSPWSPRLQLFEGDVLSFKPKRPYDLIISNPPYFTQDAPSACGASRQMARQEQAGGLGLERLLSWAGEWLSPEGNLCLVLPREREEALRRTACEQLMGISRLCYVGKGARYYNRLLCSMQSIRGQRTLLSTELRTLSLRGSCGEYSSEYKMLVSDYLKIR